MLNLKDGRAELYQWDTGRRVTVPEDVTQVHYALRPMGRSLAVDVISGEAEVPDVLLQVPGKLWVWAYVGSDLDGYTKQEKVFEIKRRNKPADYVFTPQEQKTLDEILERLKKLEESGGGVSVEIDDTLTIQGAAADAKVVGETFAELPQADWNQKDETAKDFIKNRTHWIARAREIVTATRGTDYFSFAENDPRIVPRGMYHFVDADGVKSESFMLDTGGESNKIKGDYYEIYMINALIRDPSNSVSGLISGYQIMIKNTSGAPITLVGEFAYRKIDQSFLPTPYTRGLDEYGGIVKAGELPTPNDDSFDIDEHYTPLLVDSTGKAYTDRSVIHKNNFDISLSDWFSSNASVLTMICDSPGSLSSYFPDIPESTGYPVVITKARNSNSLVVYGANGITYKASGMSIENGIVAGFANIVKTTAFFDKKYETQVVYNNFSSSSGTQTYDSIGLIEGQMYTITWIKGYNGTEESETVIAAYSEEYGMVGCTTSKPIFVGDTLAYVNPSFSSAFAGISLKQIEGEVLIPSIPAEAIDGLTVGAGGVTVIDTTADDYNPLNNAYGNKVKEALLRGDKVYVYQGDTYASVSAFKIITTTTGRSVLQVYPSVWVDTTGFVTNTDLKYIVLAITL